MTAADGTLDVAWRPDELGSGDAAVEGAGDTISLTFTWVGPTRELIIRRLDIAVAHAPLALSLEVPAHADLPYHPFEVTVALASLPELGGAPAAGVDIKVALLPAPTSTDLVPFASVPADALDLEALGIPPPAAPGAAVLAGGGGSSSECVATTNAAGRARTPCSLKIDASAGTRTVLACTLDASGARELCSAVAVGRTREEWEEAPLESYLGVAVTPEADAAEYPAGGTAVITLQNPLSTPLTALVSYGSASERQVLRFGPLAGGAMADASDGRHTLSLPLGAGCDGGCDALVLLVAAADELRTHIGADAGVPRQAALPTSPLFDPRAPMLAAHTVALNVAERTDASLTLSVVPADAVRPPGAATEIAVTLTDGDGAPVAGEVTLFAVDKSLLLLVPHPPADLATTFAPNGQLRLGAAVQPRGRSSRRRPPSTLASLGWKNASPSTLAERQVAAAPRWLCDGRVGAQQAARRQHRLADADAVRRLR